MHLLQAETYSLSAWNRVGEGSGCVGVVIGREASARHFEIVAASAWWAKRIWASVWECMTVSILWRADKMFALRSSVE
jgi:hypothetical protein